MSDEFTNIAQDCAAGAASGFAMVLTSHPFDTIKVRMQMGEPSIMACIKHIYKNEGIRAFYKGMSSPLFSGGFLNASVFMSYEYYRRFFDLEDIEDCTLTHGLLAGSFAGLV